MAHRLTAAVDLSRGGKIHSLRSGDTEWLTQAAPGSYARGLSFGDAEMAGWDECSPSITACTVEGVAVPDHGDAWDAPWSGDAFDALHEGTSLPYRLRRTITPTDAGGLRLHYRAETAAASMPFMWTAHPQFAAPGGTRLEFAEPPRRVIDVLAPGMPALAWDEAFASLTEVASGGCRKFYLDPDERISSVDLVRPDAPRLRLEFSPSIPYLALWFDNAAYASEPIIGIEPSLGGHDDLAVAAATGRTATLSRGAAVEWSLTVTALD